MFYHLDSSGRLYGTLLSLTLPSKKATNCAVLPNVSKFISFRNAVFQTSLLFPGAYESYG